MFKAAERGFRSASIEFLFHVLDAPRKQILGHLAFGGCGKDFLCSGDGGIGRGGAHIGQRLSLGLGDLRLRHLGTTGDEVFHTRLGLGGKTLGLGLGAGDDGFGLAFGRTSFALEVGE